MKTEEELIERAKVLAEEIEADLKFSPTDRQGYGGYWVAVDEGRRSSILANATTALEFLSTYAGRSSEWYERARLAYDSSGGGKSLESGVHAMAEILQRWAVNVESGIATVRGESVSSARAIATIEVMEQVRLLNEDKGVHPAAPIVLAGAALETALRGAVAEAELDIVGVPSISAYATALRAADLISKQEMKDVTQMAGLRNSAAHGNFNELSTERAGLMEQHVNFFLSRLSERFGD